ncbi:MAG: ABC transporter permease [Planctomycetota bacterium]|nr:ABC transporter permease [Planctomycetota bacterium]
MRWLAVFGSALRRLRQRPVRTFLLLQGTIWGVAVAIFPSAVIQGTREAARTQGFELGADRIAIRADTTPHEARGLVRADLERIRAAVESDGTVLAALGGARVATSLPQEGREPLTVLEATPGVEPARGHVLAAGRWLTAEDGPTHCVVESGVAAWLGRSALEPGDRIQLAGWPAALDVVGVCAPRSAQARRTNDLGFDLEHPLYRKVGVPLLFAMGIMPVPDAWKRSETCVHVPAPPGATDELHWVFLRVDPSAVSETAARVRERMNDDGLAVVMLYPLVLPMILGDAVERFDAVNLAMFLACLLMGAVVMLNLGLLAALTRSREIAIRRTEGATRGDIALQFVAEGLVLALLGAALGCALGMLLAHLRASLEPVAGFTWTFPVREASVAVLVALLAGLLASLLPALRAARQDPVQGLADE